MLTGSPPARVLSMNDGLPNDSFGGLGVGQLGAEDRAMPAMGRIASISAGTSRTRNFIYDPSVDRPFWGISPGPGPSPAGMGLERGETHPYTRGSTRRFRWETDESSARWP